MKDSPKSMGYLQPAEWNYHSATWLAWPKSEMWTFAEKVQEEFVAFCKALTNGGETVKILVSPNDFEYARKHLFGRNIEFIQGEYGDIWLRDTGPLFLSKQRSEEQTGSMLACSCFLFNGWGGKYVFPGDEKVAKQIACLEKVKFFDYSFFVLEGGAVDTDGLGNCVTTKECLLNPNRNKDKTQEEIEIVLMEALGYQKIIWLEKGLLNDHTDGHVDNLARFIAPSVLVCMEPVENDPNREIFLQVLEQLKKSTGGNGKKMDIFTVPSCGELLNRDGEIIPGNPMNFYIANEAVIVPLYQTKYDDLILKRLEEVFKFIGKKVIGLPSYSILEEGGGSFHCITQQQPKILYK